MSDRYRAPDVFGHDFHIRAEGHRREAQRADKYEPSHAIREAAIARADRERLTYHERASIELSGALTYKLPTVEVDDDGNPITAAKDGAK